MTPEAWLAEYMRKYPELPAAVVKFLAGRQELGDWPKWCFLPLSGRYTQGIYRIDPDVFAALRESYVSGELPDAVFEKLPEWCVYVETPGCFYAKTPVDGFWAHLEADANTGRKELRFLFNLGESVVPFPLHLEGGTLREAIDASFSEANWQAEKHNYPTNFAPWRTLQAEIESFISLLLYLCSDEPEIDNEREPGTAPHRVYPEKTKKGLKLFPPKKPRIWTIGAKTGALLRKAKEAKAGEESGRSVRAHIRRGHWHGFWLGPREGKRTFTYHWIPSLLVGGYKEEDK